MCIKLSNGAGACCLFHDYARVIQTCWCEKDKYQPGSLLLLINTVCEIIFEIIFTSLRFLVPILFSKLSFVNQLFSNIDINIYYIQNLLKHLCTKVFRKYLENYFKQLFSLPNMIDFSLIFVSHIL